MSLGMNEKALSPATQRWFIAYTTDNNENTKVRNQTLTAIALLALGIVVSIICEKRSTNYYSEDMNAVPHLIGLILVGAGILACYERNVTILNVPSPGRCAAICERIRNNTFSWDSYRCKQLIDWGIVSTESLNKFNNLRSEIEPKKYSLEHKISKYLVKNYANSNAEDEEEVRGLRKEIDCLEGELATVLESIKQNLPNPNELVHIKQM